MGLLRFLLAISVVISHSTTIFGISLVGGSMAVQLFFIISGFYMALILNEKYIGANNSYKLFITNRLLRLYPIYWVVLIASIAYSLIFYRLSGYGFELLQPYVDYYDAMSFSSFIFFIFTNIFLFLQDIVMYLGLNLETGTLFFTSDFTKTNPLCYKFLLIPQAWSIGIEITFYLIAPFIARKKTFIILILIILSLLLRVILYQNGLSHDPWSYRFFSTELVFFLAGIISYQIYVKADKYKFNKINLFILLVIVIASLFVFSSINYSHKEILYVLLITFSISFLFILTKKIN